MVAVQNNKKQPVRAAAAAFLGTTIEWYDYFCYATAAALAFSQVFFQTGDKFTGLLAALATFAVGFVARPVGAILFGHLGDKVGRKKALIATLWLMGGASTLIGLIPSYDSIGVAAAVLLVILRLVQGVAVGGEWGGAVLIAAEHAPPKWRIFLSAAPQYGSPVGLIMATLVFDAVSSLPEEDFLAWGWRIPFLLSVVMVFVAYFIRRGVNESPELEEYKAKQERENKEADAPLKLLFSQYKKQLFLGVSLSMMAVAGFYFITTLMISYTTNYLSVQRTDILGVITYVGIVELLSLPVASWLATKYGERRIILIVSALAVLWAIPMMDLVHTRDVTNISIAILVATVFIGLYYAVLAAYLPRAFPIEVRYSGVSLSFQLCGALFGGTTPIVGLWIAEHYGVQTLPMASLFIFISLATFIGAFFLPKDSEAAEAQAGDAQLQRN